MTDETKPATENDDPTPEEVVATVSKTARRIADALLEDIPGGPAVRAAIAEKIERVFLEDEEIASAFILRGAYEEGSEDAALEFARQGADPGPRSPDWSDVRSEGEARAIRREENLCGKCAIAPVCVVARLAPPEALLVVRRCALYRG